MLGGAIGGGMTVNKKYEEWRDGLPDLKWLDEVLPDTEQFRAFNKNLSTTLASFKNSVQLDPRIKQAGENKLAELREWFDNRLENAIEAAEEQEKKTTGFETTERMYMCYQKCFPLLSI